MGLEFPDDIPNARTNLLHNHSTAATSPQLKEAISEWPRSDSRVRISLKELLNKKVHVSLKRKKGTQLNGTNGRHN
jgi:hypothetical protein